MYIVNVEKNVSSSHFLRDYDGVCSKLHGHNFKIILEITGDKLVNGMLVDFVDVDSALSELLDKIDHYLLNDVKPFDVLNPTAENIAKWIFDSMTEVMEDSKITSVTVFETDKFSAKYMA